MAWRRSAVRIYRALLFAYPAEFRHEYGSEMQQLFEDRLHSEPALRVWLDTLPDLAFSAVKEHLHILAADLVYGTRLIRKSPAFTLVALFAMALGIGATTAVFSLINAVLIRSLPYGDPERLVYIWTPNPRFKEIPTEMAPSAVDFYAWQNGNQSFSDLTIFNQDLLKMIDADRVQRIGGASVAGNFFHTLGAFPQLGRALEPGDDQLGHEHVAVISDALWRSRFGGSPNVLGKTLNLNHEIYTIVGVMAREFRYPTSADFPYSERDVSNTAIWTPAVFTPQQKADWNAGGDGLVIGRLKPGVGLKQAQAEMSALEARLDPILHKQWPGWVAVVRPFVETAIGPVRPLLWMLMGAVSLVLLIACSNVANLLLARAAGRVHEMGVRTALGAERVRLVRQMLTEALLLALGGGALGVLIAYAALRLVLWVHPGNIPRLDETSLDARVLLFTIGASLLTGLAFGLLPALAASRVSVNSLLKQGGNKGIAGTSNRLRNGLIITQVALSVILLAGSGLLIRSYLNVQSVDSGYAPSTLTMNVILDERYGTPQKIIGYFRNLIAQVNQLPGVQSFGLVSSLPLSHRESISTVEIKGQTVKKDEMVDDRMATTAYFESMGIRLLEGRFFADEAVRDHPFEMLVSQSFAKLYFPRESAIGHEFRSRDQWHTIAGVVSDVRHVSPEESPRPTVYSPFLQIPDNHAYLTIRTTSAPDQLIASIGKIVRSIDPNIAPEHASTMRQFMSEATSARRFQTVVLSVFAAVAVFLALVGLYGLMAYAVKQRTAEIGIRIALGASATRVLSMVVSKGLTLVAAGLVFGLAGALVLTRLGTSWLYGVSPADPLTLIAVPLLILAVALVACLIPAWKAARIDPVTALRFE
ncbi:MAG: ABC transporter permease [Bryobacteraceae bacterium]|jgi:putative ABC transport system permease protein